MLISIIISSSTLRPFSFLTGDDYLVDHSIIHYLINPAGEFVTFYAKSFSAEQMAESIAGHLADWQQAHPEYHKGHTIVKPTPAKP